MAEVIVLCAFAAGLLLSVMLGLSLVPALVFGFFLFFSYGLYRKHTAREMLRLAFSGVRTVRGILFIFVLIGLLTAFWRAGGTIPFIVYYAASLCDPRVMTLLSFLLCAAVSFLTGTSVGTAATMGVICVTMADSMGLPILCTGGAVLAGAYFGDRCSPMSTSALLVAAVTRTDLYRNLLVMMRTSYVPLAAACLCYGAAGFLFDVHPDASDVWSVFAAHFDLHPLTLLPAAAMLLLSLCRVPVRYAMGVSILCGAGCMLLVQGASPAALAETALWGFRPADRETARLLSGGGIASMVSIFCIVCLSACYTGMLQGTGLLRGLETQLARLSARATPFGSIFFTSVLTAMIFCNQTLAILITHQLCSPLEPDRYRMASHLENTAVVISPLVPWSVACAVPLAAIGAPLSCLPAACYLYFLPLWNLAAELRRRSRIRS